MTALTRWSPFHCSAVFPFDFWGGVTPPRPNLDVPLKLGVDVAHNAERYTIEASLPGFDPEKIDVTVDDGVLRIVAKNESEETKESGSYLVRERRSGSFFRALRIPEGVDINAATTSYKNGILEIKLPKSESEQPKRLPIAA